MPKQATPLTATEVKNAKPKDKLYKLNDGGGLALWVYPTGNKNWVMRVMANGRREELRRPFEGCTLAEARAWREDIRQKARRGEPLKEAPAEAGTFRAVFAEWFERWQSGVSAKYGKQVKAAVEDNVMPTLGDMNVTDIRPVHVVESLKGMEERGVLAYLKRTKVGVKLALDYAVARGMIDMNPAMGVTAKAFRKHTTTHFRALSPDALPQLVEVIERGAADGRIKPLTYRLIYWQLFTMVRPGEAVAARWADIDEAKALWTIAPEQMKARRGHTVPLVAQTLKIVRELQTSSLKGEYLFEGRSRGHMNAETVRMAMQRLGMDTTAHGFRSLARSYLGETGRFRREALELCLAHNVGSKTEQAYDRGQYLEERREIMAYWAGEIEALRRKFGKTDS